MASEIVDGNGNKISCVNGRVCLQLAGSAKVRCLGIISDGVFNTRRQLSHVMRGQKDIGFNYSLIRRGKFEFVEVELLPEGKIIRTTRSNILENGKVENFKSRGFELQVFLPIDKFATQGQLFEETSV